MLSPDDVAARLNCSAETARRLMRQMGAVDISPNPDRKYRMLRVAVGRLEAYLAGQVVQTPPALDTLNTPKQPKKCSSSETPLYSIIDGKYHIPRKRGENT